MVVFLFVIDKHVHFYMYIDEYMENMKDIYEAVVWNSSIKIRC